MSKVRNKKHNKQKHAAHIARLSLRNLAVWHSHNTESEYTAELISTKTFKTRAINPSIMSAVMKVRHKWHVLLLAIGEDDNGKKYFKVDPVPLITPMFQSEMVEYLDQRHKDFVHEKFNKNHLTNVAWLALPNGDEADRLSDQDIDRLITTKNAW